MEVSFGYFNKDRNTSFPECGAILSSLVPATSVIFLISYVTMLEKNSHYSNYTKKHIIMKNMLFLFYEYDALMDLTSLFSVICPEIKRTGLKPVNISV